MSFIYVQQELQIASQTFPFLKEQLLQGVLHWSLWQSFYIKKNLERESVYHYQNEKPLQVYDNFLSSTSSYWRNVFGNHIEEGIPEGIPEGTQVKHDITSFFLGGDCGICLEISAFFMMFSGIAVLAPETRIFRRVSIHP